MKAGAGNRVRLRAAVDVCSKLELQKMLDEEAELLQSLSLELWQHCGTVEGLGDLQPLGGLASLEDLLKIEYAPIS